MTIIIDEMHRFRMLVAGIAVGLGVSTTYGFSLFTEHMKNRYGFTQGEITTVSTVGNCMANCAFLLGVIFDVAGPKVQLIFSATLASLGLLLFGLSFDDVINSDNKNTMVILFSVFSGIMYLGCPSLDGGSILPLMMNFPLHRGYMIIIQKTFSGLGTSVLMIYFNAFFRSASDPLGGKQYSSYSYFLATQVMVFAIIGAIFIDLPVYSPCGWQRNRMSPEELEKRQATLSIYMKQVPPRRRLYIGCGLVFFLLIYLTVVSVYGGFMNISVTAYRVLWCFMMIDLLLFILLAVPFQFLGRYRVPDRPCEWSSAFGEVDETEDDGAGTPQPDDKEDGTSPNREALPTQEDGDVLLEEADTTVKYGHHAAHGTTEPIEDNEKEESAAQPVPISMSGDPQYTGSFWGHLLSIDLWLFWLSFFGMWGTGIVMIFNSAQIYRSINYGEYNSAHQALYVAMIGVGSAVGRILSGVFDMWVSKRRARGLRNIYTTLFFPLSSLFLAFGFLLMALVPAKAIVVPFVLAAVGNGMGWGLGVLCVRIVYAEDIGKHYNFMWSAGLVATVALNRFMFGDMFDTQANKAGTSPYCNAPVCVRNQLWILLACNIVSTGAALLLHFRFASFANAKLQQMEEERTKNLVQSEENSVVE